MCIKYGVVLIDVDALGNLGFWKFGLQNNHFNSLKVEC
jgi:hypothetical protein